MELPQIRAGKVFDDGSAPKVVAFFPNSAEGNVAIQLLTVLGIKGDRIGVTPPEQIEGGQGMVLAVSCAEPSLVPKVETICRQFNAHIHRQRQ
ncbi:MAG: hypothetical protein U0835_07125 [Isosphaeraceae bacterium]